MLKWLKLMAVAASIGIGVPAVAQSPAVSRAPSGAPVAKCAAGDASACFQAGADYQHGALASRSSVKALAMFKRGCDLRSAPSCLAAADMFEGDHGVPAAPQEFLKYARLSCQLNYANGCVRVGDEALRRRDYVAAAPLYDKACALGSCRHVQKLKDTQAAEAYKSAQLARANWEATRLAAADAERARANAAHAAGIAAIDQMLRAGNYADAINKAAYGMGSPGQVDRVLVAAQGAGRIGDIDEKYFWAFSTWSLSAEARRIVNAQQRERRLGQTAYTGAGGGATGTGAGSGNTEPSLADRVLETSRRQNRENCAAAAQGANRVCNPR